VREGRGDICSLLINLIVLLLDNYTILEAKSSHIRV